MSCVAVCPSLLATLWQSCLFNWKQACGKGTNLLFPLRASYSIPSSEHLAAKLKTQKTDLLSFTSKLIHIDVRHIQHLSTLHRVKVERFFFVQQLRFELSTYLFIFIYIESDFTGVIQIYRFYRDLFKLNTFAKKNINSQNKKKQNVGKSTEW